MNRMRSLAWITPVLLAAGCGSEDAQRPAANTAAAAPQSQLTSSTHSEGAQPAGAHAGGAQAAATNAASLPVPVDALSSRKAEAEAAFQALIESTHGSDPEAWSTAEKRLRELGKDAIPTYCEALTSTDRNAREMASMFLGQLGPDAEAAQESLVATLNDESSFVRVNSASLLSIFNVETERVSAVLAELLSHADVNIRLTSAVALGNLGESAAPALPALTAALQDEDPRVRSAAASTLGAMGAAAQPARSSLAELERDPDSGTRQAAVTAIGQIDRERDGTKGIIEPASLGEDNTPLLLTPPGE